MNKLLLLLLFCYSFASNAQSKLIENIAWKGTKKMNTKFMTAFIQSKIDMPLDSLLLQQDIEALTRLNGISKVTFEVNHSNKDKYNVVFLVSEDLSIIPFISLWTTDATTAFQIGIYDYNFLGKNNSIGGFYQYNGVDSYGLNYVAPFGFNTKIGFEANIQKLSSFEPIFFENKTAKYQYTNTAAEILAIYRLNYRNSFKIGFSILNENYQYQSGATSSDVPLKLKTLKYMLKSKYLFDNLKYDFYLIEGFKNAVEFQLVKNTNEFQNNFVIGWNDLSYFRRVGQNGNWASRLRLGLSTNAFSPFSPFAVDNNINIRGVGNLIDRGTGSIVINSEFRKTFFEKNWFIIQGNVFVDAGTWREPGGNFSDFIAKKNVRVYPGFGLRFIHKSIFNAVFRLDYGFGITENANKGLVFGIGQYF